MEWIGIGIAVAIGFYLAPFILGAIVFGVAAVAVGICRLFGGCR